MTTLSAEVAEAVRLRDAAEPGPWAVLNRGEARNMLVTDAEGFTIAQPLGVKSMHEWALNNSALIAAAPSHVDLIERLHARVRELEALIRTIDDALSE